VIISLVFLNKKRKNHPQSKVKSEKQIFKSIKKLCRLEAKVLDFYDYKKTLEKINKDKERRKNENN
jgi:hypothetical protein|tara:strand:+ start:1460 stop:1657 length:198 start_codon:yes stop_codon:yes gene_type:complete